MKKLLATMLAFVMALALCTTAWADQKPVQVNGTGYDTLEAAFAAAAPTDGVITYEIYGKVQVTGTGWIQIAKKDAALTKVAFVGKTEDAEICITQGAAILADQQNDIDVSFEDLKLTKENPTWANDFGHGTRYFTTWLRNNGAGENTVTYTNCTFPNGSCNNQYGKTVYDTCKFENSAAGLFNLWNYGGDTEVKNSTFTGTRGVKVYNEGTATVTPTVAIEDSSFDGLTEKAAIVVSKPAGVTVENMTVTNSTTGVFAKDMEGATDDQVVTIGGNGSDISGAFNVTSEKDPAAAVNEFSITGGAFTDKSAAAYLADDLTTEVKDGVYTVVSSSGELGAGTYTDKPENVPNGYEIVENSDGTFTVKKTITYYYPSYSATTSTTDSSKSSPKTFDAGVAMYVGMAVMSVTGMAYVGKKKF